jgi:FAD/FMN-containing dehydrogenase
MNPLVSTTGASVPERAVEALAAGLAGQVIRPGDARYDAARTVFNGMIDRRPGLVVRPANTEDVRRCIAFARERDLLLSVKGGGHSVQGYGVCDGGLTLDLSGMQGIAVDPARRTAVAGTGVTWGAFDAATQRHGLAVTGGRVPSTGIAGLTLGSGSGWLERKLGYTVDNLTACEIVTAKGDVLRASEQDHPDLFWGLRGGGGNFGVVTEFEYRLHPIGPIVYGGQFVFPRDPGVLKAYRDFMERAPHDVCGAAALITAPHADFVPEPVRGTPVMGIIVCYTGKPEDGPRAFKPMLDLKPALNLAQPMPYVEVQRLIEPANPPGLRNYWKADMYPELPDAAIETLMEAAAEPPSPWITVLVQPLGGAIHRVPDGVTAMGWRSAKWGLHILAMWERPEDDERTIAWVRDLDRAMKPWAQEASYLNYLMDEGDARIRASFGTHYERIAALKATYDPANVFCLNQNIRPAGTRAT